MGDRTRVCLTIMTAQKDEAEAIFNNEFQDYWEYEGLVEYSFDECNYANTGFENNLPNAGIAFDKQWDAGGDYPSGHSYTRFDPTGLLHLTEFDDTTYNPNLHDCMAIIDSPEDDDMTKYRQLEKLIRHHYEDVTPQYPLDEAQITYGKVYRTRQLVRPKENAA